MRRVAVVFLIFVFIFVGIALPVTAFGGAADKRAEAGGTRTERAQVTLDAGPLSGTFEVLPAGADSPAGVTVILDEDFEGAFPTGAWSAPAGTQSCTWDSTDAEADTGTFSGSPVAAGCNPAIDPLTGPLPANALIALIYGPFDLSTATSAQMSFRHAQQLESEGGNPDRMFYGANADCGGAFGGFNVLGGDFSWQDRNLDLGTHIGSSTVCVAFLVRTDATPAVGDEGVFIDNVLISYDDTPTLADLALTLIDVPNGTYGPGGDIVIHNVTENVGTEASTAYGIDFYASLDTNITAADEHLGGFPSTPPLGPGEIDEFFDTLALPADLPEGSWFIGGILTVVDADPDNNSNFDATPINVSTDPDILVRPLSLDFDEAAMMASHHAEASAMAPSDADAAASKAQFLPELRARAASRGHVRLIVGLDTGFVPEGYLSRGQAQDQRTAIRTAGQQLITELAGLNATVRRRFELIPYLALTADLAALDRLAASPLVRSLGEDELVRPSLDSSSQVIGSPLAWAEGYDGGGFAVAVLDTGVDHTHGWFNGKLVSEACYGTDVMDEIEPFCPGGATSSTAPGSGLHCDLAITGCDHGTHVAGIAVGNDSMGPNFGVARGADLIAIQVFSKFLTEADCGPGNAPCIAAPGSDVIAGLERVALLAATIDIASANMSLGGGSFADQATCDASMGGPAYKAAIDNLRSLDIASVAATGNDGYLAEIGRPACISTAVSVGATTDADQVAVFSNVYPQIHLLAPGVDIDSSVPGNMVGVKQGTSMATPQVAGAWAVMKQRDPAATVTEVLAALQGTATPVDDLRAGGIEMDMPRINLDLALGEPRTTFGIFNTGTGPLDVGSITPQTPAPWITSISPAPPFSVDPLELQVVSVEVNFALAPKGTTQTRLLINSDDPDESPYPGGVFVNVTASGDGELIDKDGFEDIP